MIPLSRGESEMVLLDKETDRTLSQSPLSMLMTTRISKLQGCRMYIYGDVCGYSYIPRYERCLRPTRPDIQSK